MQESRASIYHSPNLPNTNILHYHSIMMETRILTLGTILSNKWQALIGFHQVFSTNFPKVEFTILCCILFPFLFFLFFNFFFLSFYNLGRLWTFGELGKLFYKRFCILYLPAVPSLLGHSYACFGLPRWHRW